MRIDDSGIEIVLPAGCPELKEEILNVAKQFKFEISEKLDIKEYMEEAGKVKFFLNIRRFASYNGNLCWYEADYDWSTLT